MEFLAAFLLGRLGQCVDILITSGRLPEAAFFARTYLPSRISEVRLPSPKRLCQSRCRARAACGTPRRGVLV